MLEKFRDNLNIRRTIKGKNRGPDSTRFPHRAAGEEPGQCEIFLVIFTYSTGSLEVS